MPTRGVLVYHRVCPPAARGTASHHGINARPGWSQILGCKPQLRLGRGAFPGTQVLSLQEMDPNPNRVPIRGRQHKRWRSTEGPGEGREMLGDLGAPLLSNAITSLSFQITPMLINTQFLSAPGPLSARQREEAGRPQAQGGCQRTHNLTGPLPFPGWSCSCHTHSPPPPTTNTPKKHSGCKSTHRTNRASCSGSCPDGGEGVPSVQGHTLVV